MIQCALQSQKRHEHALGFNAGGEPFTLYFVHNISQCVYDFNQQTVN